MSFKSLIVERDVTTPMRDDVVLRADVYRPQTSEPLPVLLQRTPYGKGFGSVAFALMAAERGYAVVIQDTRGRWASEGENAAFAYEKSDGYDTVMWAAEQPWSNGKVGMFGGSYVGYTQYAAAAEGPEALKALVPHVTFTDPYDIMYRGGAFALGVAVSWGLGAQASMELMRLSGKGEEDEAKQASMMEAFTAAMDGMTTGATFRHLPLESMPLLGRDELIPFVADLVDRAAPDDPFWQQVRVNREAITMPSFHVGGWYDIFAQETLRDFAALSKQPGAPRKLLLGPWYHGPLTGLVGEVDFGWSASDATVLLDEQQLKWFDYWLKGVENDILEGPPIRYFVMSANVWRDAETWPLPGTEYTSYYLHSGGAANSRHGDGRLALTGPIDEPVDTFIYDPRNPVPTRGGGLCCSQTALAAGAYDQREIEVRPDVLVYTSETLAQDLEVTGPVVVHLWAATSARDTDFTAKLIDVGPCGYARNVVDGIVRARYRNGLANPQLVEPHAAYEYVIDLGPTSNVFKAGHQIRLEISSSNFPAYDRNPNTGGALGTEAELRPAVQTILHDHDHLSHIVLPVIPS